MQFNPLYQDNWRQCANSSPVSLPGSTGGLREDWFDDKSLLLGLLIHRAADLGEVVGNHTKPNPSVQSDDLGFLAQMVKRFFANRVRGGIVSPN
jgi:hypothetical protein